MSGGGVGRGVVAVSRAGPRRQKAARLTVIVLVLAGVLALVGCNKGPAPASGAAASNGAAASSGAVGSGSSAGAPSGSASGAGPVLRTFTPYAASGAVNVPVLTRTRGSCWTQSIAVPGPNTYRCLAGNTIEDPCFTPPSPANPPTVVCLSAPWSGATVLTLTGPLPAAMPGGVSPGNPWALQLANGSRCVDVTGTVPTVGGVALNYVCGSGMDAGLVKSAGLPREVEFGSPTAGSLTAVAITTIWHG